MMQLTKRAGLNGLATAAVGGLATAAGVHQGSKVKGYFPGFKPAVHEALGYTGDGMNINNYVKQAAEANPAMSQFITKTAEELRGTAFYDEAVQRASEILNNAQEKVASSIWTDNRLRGHLARGAAGVAGAAAAGIGYNVLNDLYDDAKGMATKGRNFKKMMEENPDLEEFDKKKLESVFNTLHNFAGPKMSGDPNIAGTFVRNQVALHQGMPQGVDLGAVNQLITARGTHDRARKLDIPQNIPGMDIHSQQMQVERNKTDADRRDFEAKKHELEKNKHEYEKKKDLSFATKNKQENDMTSWKHKMESDKIRAWNAWVDKANEAESKGLPVPPKPAVLSGGRDSGGPPASSGGGKKRNP